MAHKIPPPVFGGNKTYERWKEEISAWELVSKVDKKDKALTVALSFPEGSEVRDRVFSEVKIADLNKDDGMKILIESLDKWNKKDELSDAYEAWTKLDTFKRESTESMEKYISQFDMRSIALNKHNVIIPKCILAFKLLDSAGLDIKDKQIVLTGVTFKEPDTMYDSMKLALKKFFGSQEVLPLAPGNANNSTNNVSSSAVRVNTEPTEEVNFTYRGRGRGKYKGGSFRSNFSGNNSKGDGQRRNLPDSQGNIRRCFTCGSQFHFASLCPKNVFVNSVEEQEDKN